jgi:hypothetical protein
MFTAAHFCKKCKKDMPEHLSQLHQFKDSPQRILIPSKKGDKLFIAVIAAIMLLSIISFNFTSLLP